MALEGIPLTLETLGLIAGPAVTAAAATWAISHFLHRHRVDDLGRQLDEATHRAGRQGERADRQTREVDRLADSLKSSQKRIETLEDDLRRGADPSAVKAIAELKSQLKDLEDLRAALRGDEDQLWKLRPPQPPADFAARMAASRTKVVTVINYKGGVGKTTLVAGLAAYLAARQMRVLVIDFDYQGSLTRTMVLGCSLPLGSSIKADRVIGGSLDGRGLTELGSDLGATLPGAKLITCGQTFDAIEFRTLLAWLVGETRDDVRFRLANLVLSPEMQNDFDYVLIDSPPRASTGAINALCASHALVVPTILDGSSVDATAQFIARTNASFRKLNPALELAAIVGTLTEATNLTPAEGQSLEEARVALSHWRSRSHLFRSRVRHFRAIAEAAGSGIAYLTERGVRQAFDALGDELVGVLHEDKAASRNAPERSQPVRAERGAAKGGLAAPVQ